MAKNKRKEPEKEDTKLEEKVAVEEKTEVQDNVDDNEENVAIIDLKTIIILIVVVVVAIIGIFIYAYINETGNKNANKVVLNTELSATSPSSAGEFDPEEGKELVEKYLAEKALALSNPQSLLQKYGYATNKQFANYEKTDDETFIKTDILYEDIRNKMQEYITKDFFAKEFKDIFKPSNGLTHVANINNPKQTYKITRYENQKTNNKPILKIWYTVTEAGNISEEKSMEVEFSTLLGKWIISNIK